MMLTLLSRNDEISRKISTIEISTALTIVHTKSEKRTRPHSRYIALPDITPGSRQITSVYNQESSLHPFHAKRYLDSSASSYRHFILALSKLSICYTTSRHLSRGFYEFGKFIHQEATTNTWGVGSTCSVDSAMSSTSIHTVRLAARSASRTLARTAQTVWACGRRVPDRESVWWSVLYSNTVWAACATQLERMGGERQTEAACGQSV